MRKKEQKADLSVQALAGPNVVYSALPYEAMSHHVRSHREQRNYLQKPITENVRDSFKNPTQKQTPH
jgi:hypothetical protein